MAWNHTSAVLATIYNVNRGSKGRVFEPIDFHPYLRREARAKRAVPLASLKKFFVRE